MMTIRPMLESRTWKLRGSNTWGNDSEHFLLLLLQFGFSYSSSFCGDCVVDGMLSPRTSSTSSTVPSVSLFICISLCLPLFLSLSLSVFVSVSLCVCLSLSLALSASAPLSLLYLSNLQQCKVELKHTKLRYVIKTHFQIQNLKSAPLLANPSTSTNQQQQQKPCMKEPDTFTMQEANFSVVFLLCAFPSIGVV